MKVYQRLAQAFKAEGTQAVFGIMGDANMYWYSELDKLGVELVDCPLTQVGLKAHHVTIHVPQVPAAMLAKRSSKDGGGRAGIA